MRFVDWLQASRSAFSDSGYWSGVVNRFSIRQPSTRCSLAVSGWRCTSARIDAVLTHDDVRRLALALPEATEQDHHGKPSFRVGGKIFATLWGPEQANVMLDEPGIRSAAQAHPDACREVYWGRRLSAVGVDLAAATEALVAELLCDAWERRAPARLRP